MDRILHPPIQLTDKDDRLWRGGTMEEAQLKGYWHRVARVMVYDPVDGLYLLQQVPPNPYYDGGLWNVTASGHVDEGETYLNAGERELEEEMGVRGLELQEYERYSTSKVVGERIFNRHNVTLLALADRAMIELRPEPDEVSATQWADITTIRRMMSASPSQVTDGLERFVRTRDARAAQAHPGAREI